MIRFMPVPNRLEAHEKVYLHDALMKPRDILATCEQIFQARIGSHAGAQAMLLLAGPAASFQSFARLNWVRWPKPS
jgi:hypothetical protein